MLEMWPVSNNNGRFAKILADLLETCDTLPHTVRYYQHLPWSSTVPGVSRDDARQCSLLSKGSYFYDQPNSLQLVYKFQYLWPIFG
jgi:hypothetical protein